MTNVIGTRSTKSSSVLVVDDHEDYGTILKALFNQAGIESTAVASAAAALALIKTKQFDLIVCDYRMPDMDGHQMFQALKTDGHDCPFLIFTACEAADLPSFESPPEFLGIFLKTSPSILLDYVSTRFKGQNSAE